MTPKPWTISALGCHDNCAWQYHEKYVAKSVVEEQTAEQAWGNFVHKQFEDYLNAKPAKPWGEGSGHELPHDLKIHEPYLLSLLDKGGVLWAEREVALKCAPFGPCRYEDPDRWWRGKLDVTVVEADQGRATIADFKTGKRHDKWDQLAMYAIWVFTAHPEVSLVNAQFYWVQTQEVTKKIWGRDDIDGLAQMFAPKLQSYVHSFKNDVWPKKQSGLCGWCPVKTCEFWRDRKRERRK